MAVDAIVALSLICATLLLSLSAARLAFKAAAAARESTVATLLLRSLLDAPCSEPGERAGVVGSLRWTERTAQAAAPGLAGAALCTRDVEAAAASGRIYRLTGLARCPNPA